MTRWIPGEVLELGGLVIALLGEGDSTGGVLGCSGGVRGGSTGRDSGSLSGDTVGSNGS